MIWTNEEEPHLAPEINKTAGEIYCLEGGDNSRDICKKNAELEASIPKMRCSFAAIIS